MSQITIDDLLKWLERIDYAYVPETDSPEYVAIRAILEQHRDSIPTELIQCFKCHKIMPDVCTFYCGDCDPATTTQLEAIRAFVERVRRKSANRSTDSVSESYWILQNAIDGELAAMEKATK